MLAFGSIPQTATREVWIGWACSTIRASKRKGRTKEGITGLTPDYTTGNLFAATNAVAAHTIPRTIFSVSIGTN